VRTEEGSEDDWEGRSRPSSMDLPLHGHV